MADMIVLVDESIHTISDETDIISLVEEKLGLEVRSLIEDLIAKLEPSGDSKRLEDGQRKRSNRVYLQNRHAQLPKL